MNTQVWHDDEWHDDLFIAIHGQGFGTFNFQDENGEWKSLIRDEVPKKVLDRPTPSLSSAT